MEDELDHNQSQLPPHPNHCALRGGACAHLALVVDARERSFGAVAVSLKEGESFVEVGFLSFWPKQTPTTRSTSGQHTLSASPSCTPLPLIRFKESSFSTLAEFFRATSEGLPALEQEQDIR